jgi:tRNA1Val (adenine37-N6)-methyltransferase
MSNNYFAFRQFVIRQEGCAMKVGTDGVLLGAWANVMGADRILDVGTGSGLIAIMLAQRSNALIDAVEIDRNAYLQAVVNAGLCPWQQRICIYNDSFQHFSVSTPVHYDLVVSNPPYFRNSLRPPGDTRSVARHDEKLGYEDLLTGTSTLLSKEGRLAVILPADEFTHVVALAYFQGLYPIHQTLVSPVLGKKHSRCLVEFGRIRNQSCKTDELIIKHDNSFYTSDYKALTGDYYLPDAIFSAE